MKMNFKGSYNWNFTENVTKEIKYLLKEFAEKHIGKMILQGLIEGELIATFNNSTYYGWWKFYYTEKLGGKIVKLSSLSIEADFSKNED